MLNALSSPRSAFVFCAMIALAGAAPASPTPGTSSLVGTWSLAVADVRHPDGTVTRDYGDAPAGRLMVDRQGNYVLVVFNRSRPKFASGDRAQGTAEEYRTAVLGMSTHLGKLSAANGEVTFAIDQAGYPNWNGAKLTRPYTLKAGTFAYEGAPRPNGDVPITSWQKVGQ